MIIYLSGPGCTSAGAPQQIVSTNARWEPCNSTLSKIEVSPVILLACHGMRRIEVALTIKEVSPVVAPRNSIIAHGVEVCRVKAIDAIAVTITRTLRRSQREIAVTNSRIEVSSVEVSPDSSDSELNRSQPEIAQSVEKKALPEIAVTISRIEVSSGKAISRIEVSSVSKFEVSPLIVVSKFEVSPLIVVSKLEVSPVRRIEVSPVIVVSRIEVSSGIAVIEVSSDIAVIDVSHVIVVRRIEVSPLIVVTVSEPLNSMSEVRPVEVSSVEVSPVEVSPVIVVSRIEVSPVIVVTMIEVSPVIEVTMIEVSPVIEVSRIEVSSVSRIEVSSGIAVIVIEVSPVIVVIEVSPIIVLKEKKGRWKFLKRWKTRYFTLSGSQITYSKSDSVSHLMTVLIKNIVSGDNWI
ncbi:hypothetical protein DPMN_125417 [Dreissena polymorpha]|uniref:Uncharacterized protein n=1 Tax=Dreissena polymorpha TaxID=45954 RepID=A0A9D4JX60_DREPO|nr:hypothetical protein DPMN_125417 [Dreissena polymorpha]